MDINSIGAQVTRIGGKVKDSASKTKETWKIDTQIKELQSELNDAYRILGFTFYETVKEGGASRDDAFCVQSKGLLDEMDEKSRKLTALLKEKGSLAQGFCTQCGSPVPENSMFCPYCGVACGR